jgi:O-antigen ligase
MLRPAHVLSAQPSVLGRHGAGLLMVAAAGAVAFAVATDRPRSATVVASIPLVAVLVGELVRRAARTPANVRSASVVLALLIASTFVWRTRTTTALDSNPLDAAALVRVGLVVTAGLAALVMAVREPVVRALPGSLRWLRAYVAVAAISGLASPLPLQGSYRAFELAVGLVALVGAISLLRERAPAILVRFLVRTIGCLVAVIWLEALVAPAKAWSPSVSVLPYELQGYLPQYSSNTVGLFGGLLALYGLAEAGRTRRANGLALVAGLATLVASQYRTGIVAFIVVGLLVLWRRRPGRVAVLLVAVLPVVVGLGWARISEQSAQLFDKGRPELVGSLDSRTVYWRAAAPFIRQRPLLGWGINVESRRVLASLGDETTSTIHSTWVEALLGTGVVGTFFLALAFVSALRQGLRARASPLGLAVAAMLGFMCIRSVTGTTVEIFDVGFVIFVALAFAAARLDRVRGTS